MSDDDVTLQLIQTKYMYVHYVSKKR